MRVAGMQMITRLRPLTGAALLASLLSLLAFPVTAQRPVHGDPLLLSQYGGRYRLSPTFVLISFRVAGGTVEALVLHQGGAELEMRRLD